MAYDISKVVFTEIEHSMAAALEALIEEFSDGFQFDDVSAILAASSLIEYLVADGDRTVMVRRLINLAMMLERNNSFLSSLVASEV